MLRHRVRSAVLICSGLILATLYAPAWSVLIFLTAVASIAMLEFCHMLDLARIPVFRIYGVVCGIAIITVTFFTLGPSPEQLAQSYKWECFILFATVVVVCVRQFPQKHNDQPLATVACTLLGVLYVPFLINYFTRILFTWDDVGIRDSLGRTGQLLLFYAMVVIKSGDIGAYFVGRKWGRHKLFERVSPSKTWEGLGGGVSASLAGSLCFFYSVGGVMGQVSMRLHDAIILGIVLSLVGTVGDLFESLLKRAAGMKDSGSTIPGMGGVLDVLDSLLFAAPLLYIYAIMFLPST
jgi:phosphatidate cytidylyltransferase|tara:strand:- start:189 stop:1070 length:882 start_codon:yes stop_codon:yes gene_type:complete